MALTVREALATDAPAVDRLAKQFASYLRNLGDQTDFKLTAEAYRRDGFGLRPAFKGLVAEDDGLSLATCSTTLVTTRTEHLATCTL